MRRRPRRRLRRGHRARRFRTPRPRRWRRSGPCGAVEGGRSLDRPHDVAGTDRVTGREREIRPEPEHVPQAVDGCLGDRGRQVRHDRRAQRAADAPVAEEAVVRQQRQAAAHIEVPGRIRERLGTSAARLTSRNVPPRCAVGTPRIVITGPPAASQTDCGLPSSGKRGRVARCGIDPDHGGRRGHRDPDDAATDGERTGVTAELELLLDRARRRIDAGEGAVVGVDDPEMIAVRRDRCRSVADRDPVDDVARVRIHAHDVARLVVGDPDVARGRRHAQRRATDRERFDASSVTGSILDRCRRACS